MATLTIKLPKDPEQFKALMERAGVDHLFNRDEKRIYGRDLVAGKRYFLKKEDALRAKNGCIACVVKLVGYEHTDHYYAVLANKGVDHATFILMFEKLWANIISHPDEIDKYTAHKPLIDNEIWEGTGLD